MSSCLCRVSVQSIKLLRVCGVCNTKSRANPKFVCRVGHAMSYPVSLSCQRVRHVRVSTCSCCNWQVACQLETFGQLAQCCSALGTQLAVRSACNAFRVPLRSLCQSRRVLRMSVTCSAFEPQQLERRGTLLSWFRLRGAASRAARGSLGYSLAPARYFYPYSRGTGEPSRHSVAG